MKNSKNSKTKLMIAVLIALLLVLYKTMFVTSPVEEPIVEESTDGVVPVTESIIDQTLAKLEMMNFDLSAINDTKFMSLESIEKPLIQTTIGKKNPFAVILGSQTK